MGFDYIKIHLLLKNEQQILKCIINLTTKERTTTKIEKNINIVAMI